MESSREIATRSLLKKFTSYSQSQVTDIIKLLDLAKEIDPLTATESSWDEESAHQILRLFKSYFSFKNIKVNSEEITVEFDPINLSIHLLFYLSLLEHNIANRKGSLSTIVYDSAEIRAKAKIPEILSFKGYVLDRYRCEGDYARYFDFLFFGCGRLKENPSLETVIFFRITKNQIQDFFNINKMPEIGSYLDFTNHGKDISVNEEAFIEVKASGRSIPLSAFWGGRKR